MFSWRVILIKVCSVLTTILGEDTNSYVTHYQYLQCITVVSFVYFESIDVFNNAISDNTTTIETLNSEDNNLLIADTSSNVL